ncbi:MAG: heme ABC exporter ATP-binding protein CcmA [Chloroflexi bacterium]|nr:heme ABC exporter ATP-binding protein CcmA [Chloroflexota bacterium]
MKAPAQGAAGGPTRHASDADEWGAPGIQAHDIRVMLGERPVLRGVSLEAAAGARLAILGPNGAGKSTLLRVLAGLLRPQHGGVSISGVPFQRDAQAARRAVGLVGHQPMVYPELTVAENLHFYGRLYGVPKLTERVETQLRRVDLADRAATPAGVLSRGMLQRLALARATLHWPTLLLLDEADAGLDAHAFGILQEVVAEAVEGGATVVLTSHDLHHVVELADEVIVLRQGRVAGGFSVGGLDPAVLQTRYLDALETPPSPRDRRRPASVGLTQT